MIAEGTLGRVWPKPRLRIPEHPESFLEPDFVLSEPLVAHICANLRIVDLKLPDDKLVAGAKRHRRFSHKLADALAQLHDYRKHFNRPDLVDELAAKFGVAPQHPRLAVLIGRHPTEEEREVLDARREGGLDIQIIPYDAILDTEARRTHRGL